MNMYADAGETGREAFNNVLKSASAMARGFQQLASETGDFSKRSYETSSQMLEKLAQVRSPDKAIELQSSYMREFYEAWTAQTSKVTEIIGDTTKEAFKPFGATFERAAGAATNGSSQQM